MSTRQKFLGVCFIALVLCPSVLFAQLKMPLIFSDNMVLQRDKPVPVWGWADAGAEVTVEFAGQKKTAKAELETAAAPAPSQKPPQGRWMVKLDPMKANSTPQTLIIRSQPPAPASQSPSPNPQSLTITNVLVGEVWLCSGQSNMEMPVGFLSWTGGALNYEEEIKNSPNPLVREFTAPFNPALDPTVVQLGLGRWFVADTNTTGNFSATGYFFARELQKRLKIPVAIINSSKGATFIEQWISRKKFMSDPEIASLLTRHEEEEKVGAPRRKEEYLAAHAGWREKHGRVDSGAPADGNAMAAVSADTSDWKTVKLPGSSAKVGAAHGGITWFRREVEIPAEHGEAISIGLPAAQDVYTLYINGAKFFTSAFGLRVPTYQRLPKGLVQPGKNVVAIRVHSFSGPANVGHNPAGGRNGNFRIVSMGCNSVDIPLSGQWVCKVEQEYPQTEPEPKMAPAPEIGGRLIYERGYGCFDRKIAPLAPYAIAGFVWYQGEHNGGKPYEYPKLLRMMVEDWRQHWGSNDLPFVICQLPDLGQRPEKPGPEEAGWVLIREAQAKAAVELPHVSTVNLLDTCEDGELHPRNKQEVGRRAALMALAKVYGDASVVACGPMYEAMTLKGNKAVIKFKNADGGLVARKLPATYKVNLCKPELGEKPLVLPSPNSEVQGFAICGADRNWVWANAKIDGSTVLVWSDEVPQPVAVRYAWEPHPVCNLCNKAGLPAYQFRTDDFAPVPAVKK